MASVSTPPCWSSVATDRTSPLAKLVWPVPPVPPMPSVPAPLTVPPMLLTAPSACSCPMDTLIVPVLTREG